MLPNPEARKETAPIIPDAFLLSVSKRNFFGNNDVKLTPKIIEKVLNEHAKEVNHIKPNN